MGKETIGKSYAIQKKNPLPIQKLNLKGEIIGMYASVDYAAMSDNNLDPIDLEEAIHTKKKLGGSKWASVPHIWTHRGVTYYEKPTKKSETGKYLKEQNIDDEIWNAIASPVTKLTLDGMPLRSYPSIADAAKIHKLNTLQFKLDIVSACNNGSIFHNYFWASGTLERLPEGKHFQVVNEHIDLSRVV